MKFKIPFRKKADDFDEVGPDNGLGDELDYLGPGKFQKRLPWVVVIGAYVLFVAGIAGTIAYLVLNSHAIEEEMRASRPQLNVERLQIQNVAETQEEASPETSDDVAAPDDQVAETTDGTQQEAAHAEVPEEGHGDETEATIQDDPPATESESEVAAANVDGPIEPDTFGSMLQTHPDPALIEETQVGPLPKIGEDGRQAWQVYSRPVNVLEQRPKIAVIITNLGVSDKQTEAALTLPGSMTLAFAPYSQKLDAWITQSRGAGHEVLVTLPMEPVDYPRSDPGPFALLSTLDNEQNMRRLEWVLTRGTGYVGVVNFMGSRFTSSEKIMRPVLATLRDRGLAYLDTKETTVDTVSRMANSIGVPTKSADLFIDENLSRASIVASLARLEILARERGSAVAIARPYPVTIDRLKAWSRDLQAKGLVLVPVSSLFAVGKSNDS